MLTSIEDINRFSKISNIQSSWFIFGNRNIHRVISLVLSMPTHTSSANIGGVASIWVSWNLHHPVSCMRFSHRFVICLRLLHSCCTQYPASILVLRLSIGRLTHIGNAGGPLILWRKAWIHILVQARHQSLLWSNATTVFVRKLLRVWGALLIFCQAFPAIQVVLAIKIHCDLLLLLSIYHLRYRIQILWLQCFRLYRSIFLSFVNRSWILVSNVLIAWVHEASFFDALRCLIWERIVKSIKRTVEKLCLLFSIVWSTCSDATHEILWNLILSEHWIVILPIDNWFWMI